MVDDWLTVGGTKQYVQEQMKTLSKILINCGFQMAEDKYGYIYIKLF
jgi:hypothetical protein